MFFADQVTQLLDVFPIIKVKSIQIVRKALFFKLIYTPIYTRSFPRGFSLATSSYVLDGRTALIAAKLYCGLGNYSQTAIFPRMPSVTDFQVCYHGLALGSRVHRVGKFIKEQKWSRWRVRPRNPKGDAF
jgi:hypothetical protein